jgi:choline dehydrogenase-like flavoprotein
VIVDGGGLADGATLEAEVAIVGAGPAGIVAGLELARSGVDVVIVESGEAKPNAEIQRLGDATFLTRHASMRASTRRQIGGASVIWGGRCVPYDGIDFEERALAPEARWPVRYEELEPFFQRACDWFVCGRAQFDATQVAELAETQLAPGLDDGEARTTTLERWSLPTNFGREYASDLASTEKLRLVTHLTCVSVSCEKDPLRVRHLTARTMDGKSVEVRAQRYVLAAGGLETTRLMLASRDPEPAGLGNHSGHLGRWYMSHLSGRIARVHFETDPRRTIYGHERDSDGVYVRRRFSLTPDVQMEREIPNVVGWLVNPELSDPRHRSGILSFAYLALTSPLGSRFAAEAIRDSMTKGRRGRRRDHLKNVVRDIGPTLRFAVSFGYHRFLARRKAPGFYVYSEANEYPLQFHAEHLPNPESRVWLGEEVDELGLPRLNVDLQFTRKDAEGIVRAHDIWDKHLREHGVGRLEWLVEDREASVLDQAGGGAHQAGTTRMSERPEDGVVDGNLNVHGFDDLYVASSSTFVTSSQANSTFMIVVFALRLADRLRTERQARAGESGTRSTA